MHARWRWRRVAVAMLGLLLLGLWWTRHRAARLWTVRIQSSLAVAAPWQTIELTAKVLPGPLPGMRFEWETDAGGVTQSGERARFRSGQGGEHEIRLRVRDLNGREQQARAALKVSAPVARELPSSKSVAGSPSASLPFAIVDVSVEKSAICRGEETLIRVRAHHENAAEARWLQPLIGDQRGWETPYVDYVSPPGVYRIPVRLFAPDPGGQKASPYVEDSVYLEIKDCHAPWVLMIDDRTLPSEGGESHELSVLLRQGADFVPASADAGPPPGLENVAASYAWDFGDGKQTTSRERVIHHDYPPEEDRPADDGREHTYLVSVKALDAAGRELATARKAVTVRNMLAELKRAGHRLQLKADYVAQRDAVTSLPFKLRNIDRVETATVTRATLHLIDCDNQERGTREIAPQEFLETTVLPPGAGVAGRFTWSEPGSENLCYVQVSLLGTSRPGGYEVVGYFSMTVGRSSLIVTVPEDRTALLNEAMRLLGNPPVLTLRDIQRLEDEGRIPRGVLGRPIAPGAPGSSQEPAAASHP